MTNPLLDLGRRLVVGHRGNRSRIAGNTLESLQSAIDVGADAIEFDVRTSRDGVTVLMHDETLDRTTDGHGPLASFSYAELRSVDAGARFNPRGTSRLRIPTLES